MKFLRLGSVGIIIAVIFLHAPLCSAAEGDEGWELTIAPFIWMPEVEGDVTIRGQEADVDVSFSDILDNLDMAGFLHMEARKGKFGFFLDPTYVKTSQDQDLGPLGNIKAEFEQETWLIDFGGFYRVGQWGEARPMTLDLLLGGRYYHISTEFDVDTPIPGVAVDQEKDRDLLDPVVGLRFKTYLGDRFQISLKGDIGGFDISSNSSKLSWQATGVLGYDVSKSTTIFAGYRAVNVDHEKGSNELDLTFHGPVVGLTFLFGGSKAEAAESPKDSDGYGVYDHMDSCPEAYNQILSEKRAMAVKAHLVKQGIDSGRLEAKGYGESDPIASNDTEEGRQKNRRVRFKVIR